MVRCMVSSSRTGASGHRISNRILSVPTESDPDFDQIRIRIRLLGILGEFCLISLDSVGTDEIRLGIRWSGAFDLDDEFSSFPLPSPYYKI